MNRLLLAFLFLPVLAGLGGERITDHSKVLERTASAEHAAARAAFTNSPLYAALKDDTEINKIKDLDEVKAYLKKLRAALAAQQAVEDKKSPKKTSP